ncbi:hypothetical protein MVEG_11070 [Podila verticillata NRRL 6337]|uniref:Coth-domain-containing protein n=1 Tax=Podila verticillata NRRL 6337 TaxID=1069443 RepID=A0A086TM56_9FUNG|nr:hypothetical protein MVEG_11070 [Podila verticillata NRRL 6337]
MVRILLGLAACAATALADITFNVVGLRSEDADSFGVMANGKMHKLATTKKTYPLWSANVAGVDASVSYKYVQLDKAGKVTESEKTMRKLPAGSVHTPNEFFGRRQSIYPIPTLPQVFENKLEQNSPFFRDGFIGNLFIQCPEADWKKMNVVGSYEQVKKARIQYIGANDNVVIENAKIELSGHSMREFAKLTYHIHFPKETPLLDLSSLKLRSGENDKSMIREKLYVDLLNNIGVPAQQTTYIRLFWNGEPIGLFVAMEVLRENWVRKVLHPNITNVPVGTLWRMNASGGKEANLEWHGPATKTNDNYDRYKLLVKGQDVPKDNYMSDLVAFMKDLKDYDPNKTKDPIAYWQRRLDLDVFLKSMVMEYLTTAFDAYWQSGSNYQMYHDPVTKKWIWLPMDFDDTFSRDIESYKKIPRKNKKGFESYLVSKLILDTPVINARFEDHVKTITSYIFNPKALNPYLDAYVHMIEEDVAWDRKLPRVAKGGKTYNFKLEDLYKGVQQDLKTWIKKRSAQIQRDMNFKSPTVVTNRVPPHNMHPMQLSVYGIKPQSVEPKKIKVPASVADAVPADAVPADAVPAAPTAEQEVSDTEDMKEESATAGIGENISNSASMTGSHWATLGALVAAVVLVA